MPISITAAVCREPHRPLELETLTLDDPGPGEVLVRIAASGICHTDLAVRDRQLPTPLPVVLGHEGAGVVAAVGQGVAHVAPGDRVLMSFNSCGHCPCCAADAPTYCHDFFAHNFAGARPDGTPLLHDRGGAPVHGFFFGQSAFATHAIASARNVVRIPDEAAHLPLSTLAPLGCGMMTGAGAVLRSLQVVRGRPFVVVGAGAVGLAAVMAARIAGSDPIIAVDLHAGRRALALELGASVAIDGADDPLAQIEQLCPRGIPFAFDTTGLGPLIEGLFAQLTPKGTLGLVGASPPDALLTFNETAFMGGGKRVIGILGGDSDIQGFVPELIRLYLAGRFPFDQLIRTYPFAAVNEAIAASESGEVVKSVLVMDPVLAGAA